MTPTRPHPAARAEKKGSRVQIALKKLIKKTSNTCFSRTYANDSSEYETDDSDDEEATSNTSSDLTGDYEDDAGVATSSEDITD